MVKSIAVTHKKRGRGRPATGHDPARSVRLSDEIIKRIEKWGADQEDKPPRSEAIRRLVELGLAANVDAQVEAKPRRFHASKPAAVISDADRVLALQQLITAADRGAPGAAERLAKIQALGAAAPKRGRGK
jgi:hypothetical protein